MKSVPLAEIADVNPGVNRDLKPHDLCSFVPMERVDETLGEIISSDTVPVSDVVKGYTPFQEGDVLFAKITPCMENGKCAVARDLRNGIGFGSTEFHVVRPRNVTIADWIFYFLRQPSVRALAEHRMTGTAGQRRVPANVLEELEIPLPLVPEQRRITAILRAADDERRRRRYTQTLSDGLLGETFVRMFGDPTTNPMRWKRARIVEFGTVQTGNTPPREEAKNYGGYIEWIKSDNIIDGQMYLSPSKEKLSEVGFKQCRYVEPGACLITCIAGSLESIGDVALTDRRVAFNQQINAISPVADVDPYFLYSLLLFSKSTIQENATESMKRIITKAKFESIVLYKPPLEAQRPFSDLARQYEQMRVRQQESARQSDHLFDTLLHRAFAGEL